MTTKQKIQNYITRQIANEDYDGKALRTREAKLKFLYETFKSEYGWKIERIGESKAFAEWLSGLPSAINLPYANWEIIELAKKTGGLPKNATEKQEDRILENYWNYITVNTFQLFKKYKVI